MLIRVWFTYVSPEISCVWIEYDFISLSYCKIYYTNHSLCVITRLFRPCLFIYIYIYTIIHTFTMYELYISFWQLILIRWKLAISRNINYKQIFLCKYSRQIWRMWSFKKSVFYSFVKINSSMFRKQLTFKKIPSWRDKLVCTKFL